MLVVDDLNIKAAVLDGELNDLFRTSHKDNDMYSI